MRRAVRAGAGRLRGPRAVGVGGGPARAGARLERLAIAELQEELDGQIVVADRAAEIALLGAREAPRPQRLPLPRAAWNSASASS
ncbi:hypothetical protein BE20_17785 [Sorangium cellulosum]|nr:hypothetical protein BE20_17785 [Sorangium cellulosum]